jgi:hypothetical protein
LFDGWASDAKRALALLIRILRERLEIRLGGNMFRLIKWIGRELDEDYTLDMNILGISILIEGPLVSFVSCGVALCAGVVLGLMIGWEPVIRGVAAGVILSIAIRWIGSVIKRKK